MGNATYYRSQLRHKGQVTIPGEIRRILDVKEGDELAFTVDENGRVVIERVQIIPPDQAWFWSERWQRMERGVQDDVEKNRTRQFDSPEDAINFLNKAAGGVGDAKDKVD